MIPEKLGKQNKQNKSWANRTNNRAVSTDSMDPEGELFIVVVVVVLFSISVYLLGQCFNIISEALNLPPFTSVTAKKLKTLAARYL